MRVAAHGRRRVGAARRVRRGGRCDVPDELAVVREAVGDLPILVPGVGAQDGDAAAAVRAGATSDGRGLIVSSSRSILYASSGDDFAAPRGPPRSMPALRSPSDSQQHGRHDSRAAAQLLAAAPPRRMVVLRSRPPLLRDLAHSGGVLASWDRLPGQGLVDEGWWGSVLTAALYPSRRRAIADPAPSSGSGRPQVTSARRPRTQNSLPSGSSRTTHGESPCPTSSARGAERLDSRDLLVAFTPNRADVEMNPVLHRLRLGDRDEDNTQVGKRRARLRHPERLVLLLDIPSENGPPELRDPTGIVAVDDNLAKHCAHEKTR